MKKHKEIYDKKRALSALLFAVIGAGLIISSFAATSFFSVEPELSTISGCVRTASDNAASSGSFIEFGQGVGCALDHSGKTIPINNYTVPPNAIFMSSSGGDKTSNSPDGNDSNNGASASNPVKTISRAISLVSNGGTIVMRGGEYRDWHANSTGSTIKFEGKSFNLQAYPGESPWFNGADVVADGWVNEGNNVWSRNWETPDFCGPG